MVWFVGAGPGDPELITLKGAKVISLADVIIYAGSLVSKEILKYAKKSAKIYDSAKMTLEEVADVIKDAEKNGLTTARIHTGDPSLYGAIREQIDILDNLGIEHKQVPGVSSFSAAAAALGAEYTLPGVSQSLIITRMKGRTDVPPSESVEKMAEHKTSMVYFLSSGDIAGLCKKLMTSYPPSTPAAVCYKVSWEDEKIIHGTLENIAKKSEEENIHRQALVLVGDFLGNSYEKSKLYDKTFTHAYRKGENQ